MESISISQILTISQIIEIVRPKCFETILLFVDILLHSIPYTEKNGSKELILLAYGLPKEIVAVTMLYKNMKAMVHWLNVDIDFVDIVTELLSGDTLAPYLFRICL